MESSCKKFKSDHTLYNNTLLKEIENYQKDISLSRANLTPIVADDLINPIKLTKAVIGSIKDCKNISKIIKILNEKLVLTELQHLKRVRKKQVLIFPIDYLNGKSVDEYVEDNLQEIKELFDNFSESDVPATAPQVRKQFDYANSFWPCNFHPNKNYEKVVSGQFFSDAELKIHKKIMDVVLEIVKFNLNISNSDSQTHACMTANASVVVDPCLQSVVAIASDFRTEHPTQHSVMLAIDNVAKSQNGGSWISDPKTHDATDVTLRGLQDKAFQHIKTKFSNLKFGAKRVKSKLEIRDENATDEESVGPYLCTGYDIYLFSEPCLMCSMALVHARVRRVFFLKDNIRSGALKSRTKLHTVTALNHHFKVFTGFS